MDSIPNQGGPAPEPPSAAVAPPAPPSGGDPPGPVDRALIESILQDIARLRADPRDGRTVQEVIDTYLDHVGDQITARTREMRTHTLTLFGQAFGTLRVTDPECGPLPLKQWILAQTQWVSKHTQLRVYGDIQRVFNWAQRLRLIRENPFRGLPIDRRGLRPGSAMKLAEFQAALRASDPFFRRFLVMLSFTGARPGELRELRWQQIDWDKGIAVLERHKTVHKTGRPRILVFPPPALKLLHWLYRHRAGSAAVELQRILVASPQRRLAARAATAKMRAKGFSYRQIYVARRLIGAKLKRPRRGRTLYTLPKHPLPEPPPYEEFVFLCSKTRPWTRYALCQKFRRLRKKLGLPQRCMLKGLRHHFITLAVRREVSLKALASLVGHVNTRMIEDVYCHVGDDLDYLRAAALKALGQTATPLAVRKPALPAPASPAPPPVAPAPEAVHGHAEEHQDEGKEQPRERTMQAAHVRAYELAQEAVRVRPELHGASDEQIFAWLQAQPEYQKQLPASPASFRRYLNLVRRHRKTPDHRGKGRPKRTPSIQAETPLPVQTQTTSQPGVPVASPTKR